MTSLSSAYSLEGDISGEVTVCVRMAHSCTGEVQTGH